MSQHLNFRPPAPRRVSGSQRDGLPRERHQVPDAEAAVSKPKGEGALLRLQTSCRLILRLLDGKGSPHVVIHPSCSTQVQRDGYFTNEDILAQVAAAIIVDILQKNYSHDDQFFIPSKKFERS